MEAGSKRSRRGGAAGELCPVEQRRGATARGAEGAGVGAPARVADQRRAADRKARAGAARIPRRARASAVRERAVRGLPADAASFAEGPRVRGLSRSHIPGTKRQGLESHGRCNLKAKLLASAKSVGHVISQMRDEIAIFVKVVCRLGSFTIARTSFYRR